MKIMYNKKRFKDRFIMDVLGGKISLMIGILEQEVVIVEKKGRYKGKEIEVKIKNF